MTKIITISNVKHIVHTLGFETFILGLIKYLEADFSRWESFDKTPRIGFNRNDGIMELMPICSDQYFAFKYVNGHPNNTLINKSTVVGIGLLADIQTGFPLVISEMTLLTALRTAANSAMASKYLANKNIKTFGIIGNGSQSEFQVLAHRAIFDFEKVYYYDIDKDAMSKFRKNLVGKGFELIACQNSQEVCENSDLVTTCTAAVSKGEVLKVDWIKEGQHLNCIGGDSADKTELDPKILTRAKIAIEYFEQTKIEGEIQNLGDKAKDYIQAELWEIITGKKQVRKSEKDITLFDGVGFAMEDYSVLRYIYDLSEQFDIYSHLQMTPELKDCKNLFSKIETRHVTYQGVDTRANHHHKKII